MWRALTVAAVAAAALGFVVAHRPSAGDPAQTATGGLPVSASAEEVMAAYEQALRAGDDRAARSMLGPRAGAEVDRGGELPLAGGRLPDRRYRATALSDQLAVVMIRSDGTTRDKQTGEVRPQDDSPYLAAVVVWRADPAQRWLVEGSQIGLDVNPHRRGTAGGTSGAGGTNALTLSMAIPESGTSWIVVDGAVHATATWSGPAQWEVPTVPATGTGGRDVLDVFVGPNVISASGIRFGPPP
jgi:hypothetical protein